MEKRQRSKSTSHVLEHIGDKSHYKNPIIEENRETEEGVICSNKDLRSILSGRDITPSSGHRRSLTMIRKGFQIQGFLSQKSCLERRESLKNSQCPSNHESIHKINSALLTSINDKPKMRKIGRIERNDSIIKWKRDEDDEENPDLSIDPDVIGNVIETYLNKDKYEKKRHKSMGKIIGISPLKEKSDIFGREKGLNRISRRTKSVDMTAMQKSRELTPLSFNHENYRDDVIIVDEIDRPRKLSLKCCHNLNYRKKSTTYEKLSRQIKDMNLDS